MQDNFNDFLDGLILHNLLLVSPHYLFALNLHQIFLDCVQILLWLEAEVVETMEVVGTDPLQESVEERRMAEVLQVIEGGGLALLGSLAVDPAQQQHRVVITVH